MGRAVGWRRRGWLGSRTDLGQVPPPFEHQDPILYGRNPAREVTIRIHKVCPEDRLHILQLMCERPQRACPSGFDRLGGRALAIETCGEVLQIAESGDSMSANCLLQRGKGRSLSQHVRLYVCYVLARDLWLPCARGRCDRRRG